MTTIFYTINDTVEQTITLDAENSYDVPALFEIDGDRDEVDATLRHATIGGLKLNRNMVAEAMGNDALLSAEHAVRDEYEAQL